MLRWKKGDGGKYIIRIKKMYERGVIVSYMVSDDDYVMKDKLQHYNARLMS